MTRINKYNRVYEVLKNSNEYIFSIQTPNENIALPDSLFKYYSLNKNSCDALLERYIYATHPSQLNDIFDCYDDLLDFDDESVIKTFLKPAFSATEINKMLDGDRDELNKTVRRNFREFIYRYWGIFSMSSDQHDLLMWSPYLAQASACAFLNVKMCPLRRQHTN